MKPRASREDDQIRRRIRVLDLIIETGKGPNVSRYFDTIAPERLELRFAWSRPERLGRKPDRNPDLSLESAAAGQRARLCRGRLSGVALPVHARLLLLLGKRRAELQQVFQRVVPERRAQAQQDPCKQNAPPGVGQQILIERNPGKRMPKPARALRRLGRTVENVRIRLAGHRTKLQRTEA